MSLRLSKNDYYFAILPFVAKRSTCVRRQVGCIITDKEGHVLSTGYNGVPKNFDHCIDVPCSGAGDRPGDTSKCLSVHAEQNALLQCRDKDAMHIMYCSCSPCFICAKMICNTNIETVLCAESYADTSGIDVLLDAGKVIIIAGVVYNNG